MSIVVKTTMFDFGEKNENGVCYDEKIITEAIKKYIENHKNGEMYGEMCHEGDGMDRFYVSLGNISHKIIDFDFGGGKVTCGAEILDTPKGKLAQEIMSYSKKPPKFWPRVIAKPVYELDENGKETDKIIGYKDLDIISIDIV